MLSRSWLDLLVMSAAAKTGDSAEIIRQCEEALEKDPGDLAALTWLADTLWRNGHWQRALATAHAALSLKSDSFHLHKIAASCFVDLGDPEGARSHAKFIARHQPASWAIVKAISMLLWPISFLRPIANIRGNLSRALSIEKSSDDLWIKWAKQIR